MIRQPCMNLSRIRKKRTRHSRGLCRTSTRLHRPIMSVRHDACVWKLWHSKTQKQRLAASPSTCSNLPFPWALSASWPQTAGRLRNQAPNLVRWGCGPATGILGTIRPHLQNHAKHLFKRHRTRRLYHMMVHDLGGYTSGLDVYRS